MLKSSPGEAAAKAAEDWQVARKVEGLRAEGEKVISKRAEGAQKLQAYVKETRAAAIVGDWADADGMLCRLKADGTVLVPPSRGAGGTWKVVDEDGFSTSIELTLALAQTTRNGVPAGNREHTLGERRVRHDDRHGRDDDVRLRGTGGPRAHEDVNPPHGRPGGGSNRLCLLLAGARDERNFAPPFPAL